MTRLPITLGVDIAYSRDTAAVVGVAREPTGRFCFRIGHKIWTPPVHIPHVTDFVLTCISNFRVIGIYYDPFQFVGECQRLMDAGYEQLMHSVDQNHDSTAFSNCLHVAFQRGDFYPYTDPQVRGQYQWANAQSTERGWRIVKRKQTRCIDVVVAEAMALWGMVENHDHISAQSYDEDRHAANLEELP